MTGTRKESEKQVIQSESLRSQAKETLKMSILTAGVTSPVLHLMDTGIYTAQMKGKPPKLRVAIKNFPYGYPSYLMSTSGKYFVYFFA